MALMFFSSLSFNNYQYVMTLISCKPLSNLPQIVMLLYLQILHMYLPYVLSFQNNHYTTTTKKKMVSSKYHLISTVLMCPLFPCIFKTLLIHRFLLGFPFPSLPPTFSSSQSLLLFCFCC